MLRASIQTSPIGIKLVELIYVVLDIAEGDHQPDVAKIPANPLTT